MLLDSITLPEKACYWLQYKDCFDFRRNVYKAYNKENSVYEPYYKQWKEAHGFSLLFTSGTIPIHEDSEEIPRYSYHAIIKNDGFVAKGPRQRASPQRPGTILCLDIHSPHHVIQDSRVRSIRDSEYPTWASLVFNVDKLMPWWEVIETFRSKFQQVEQFLVEESFRPSN
jgi:hypothetical protein